MSSQSHVRRCGANFKPEELSHRLAALSHEPSTPSSDASHKEFGSEEKDLPLDASHKESGSKEKDLSALAKLEERASTLSKRVKNDAELGYVSCKKNARRLY